MNSSAVRIAVPNVNNYVNPRSLAWLGDQLEPVGSAAGQLQRELLKAAELLVAEGIRRLADPGSAPGDIHVPSSAAEAEALLASTPRAVKWRSLVAKMRELDTLLADPTQSA